MRDTFKTIPPDRLLIETDAPDMLPPEHIITYPLTKQLNHPANLSSIYEAAADVLDTSRVDDNFCRFFDR